MTTSDPHNWPDDAGEGLKVQGKNQHPLPAPPVLTGQVPLVEDDEPVE